MLIVIMLFLQNLRAMLVPATTVPVTIIGAFIAMALLGFTVNLMTLFALILAIGIVVDDAIIIVENSSHYIEQGLTPKDAAIKAMSELTGPMLGVTLVLTSVFLPASFLPGITGQMFRQFALVIAATAIISAVNALTLSPAQCALYLRPRKDKKPNLLLPRVQSGLRGRRRRATLAWCAAWCAIPPHGAGVHRCGRDCRLRSSCDTQRRFCRSRIRATSIVVAKLPDGASQPRVREVASSIDAIFKETPGVKGWVTSGGFSELDSANLSTVVTVYVMYEDWGKRPADLTQDKIVADLQTRLAAIRKANVRLDSAADSWPRLGRRLPDDAGGPYRHRPQANCEKTADGDLLQRPNAGSQAATGSQRPSAPPARRSISISTAPWRGRSGFHQ